MDRSRRRQRQPPHGIRRRDLNKVLRERRMQTFRATLFADPAMPDDLAFMYEDLAKQHGVRLALEVLLRCREFAAAHYLDLTPDPQGAASSAPTDVGNEIGGDDGAD